MIKKEILRFRRGQKGSPWKVLDFSLGEGIAAEGKLSTYEDVKLAKRRKQRLDSPDILAIKGLGQFREFEAVSAFRRLIEDWYVSEYSQVRNVLNLHVLKNSIILNCQCFNFHPISFQTN